MPIHVAYPLKISAGFVFYVFCCINVNTKSVNPIALRKAKTLWLFSINKKIIVLENSLDPNEAKTPYQDLLCFPSNL